MVWKHILEGIVIGGRAAIEKLWHLYRKCRIIFALDTRSIALFRIAMALVVLFDLIDRIPFIYEHYTDHGLVPRSMAEQEHLLSFYYMSGEYDFVYIQFIVHFIVAIAVLVGWHTRISTALLWLLQHSLVVRTPVLSHQGDAVVRSALFWAMWIPLGEKFSLDAFLHNIHTQPTRQTRNTAYFSLASVAMIGQQASMYSNLFLSRSLSFDWIGGEGIALYKLLRLGYYETPWSQTVLDYNQTFVTNYGLDVIAYATTFLLYWDGYAFLLFFSPVWPQALRLVSSLFYTSLHFSFMFLISGGHYHFACFAWTLILLPQSLWDYLLVRRTNQRAGLKAVYPARCLICKYISALLRTFVLIGSTDISESKDTTAEALDRNEGAHVWLVRESDGRITRGSDAFLTLCKHSPWPCLWMGYYMLRIRKLRKVKDWLKTAIQFSVRMTHRLFPAIGHKFLAQGNRRRRTSSGGWSQLEKGIKRPQQPQHQQQPHKTTNIAERGVDTANLRRKRAVLLTAFKFGWWLMMFIFLLLSMTAALVWHLDNLPQAAPVEMATPMPIPDNNTSTIYEGMKEMAKYLGLDQKWALYSALLHMDFWLSFEAHFAGSTEVLDLWGPDFLLWIPHNITDAPPEDFHAAFINHRWYAFYYAAVFAADNVKTSLGDFICNEWNKNTSRPFLEYLQIYRVDGSVVHSYPQRPPVEPSDTSMPDPNNPLMPNLPVIEVSDDEGDSLSRRRSNSRLKKKPRKTGGRFSRRKSSRWAVAQVAPQIRKPERLFIHSVNCTRRS